MTILRIRLFGQVELRYGDEPLAALDSARAESLLAYLLLHREAPQQRQRLAFVLWPDSTESQARTNLRHLLHTLRRALPDPDRLLEVTARTLRWRADAPTGWMWRSSRSCWPTRTARAKRRPPARHWSGPSRPTPRTCWRTTTTSGWRTTESGCGSAVPPPWSKLTGWCEAAGELSRALGYAERLVRHDPLREDGYRLVMRICAAQGDRAGRCGPTTSACPPSRASWASGRRRRRARHTRRCRVPSPRAKSRARPRSPSGLPWSGAQLSGRR